MQLSINASANLANPNLEVLREHAKQAKADGFAGWWLAQTGLVDALTVFTAIASEVPDIEFGTAVIPTYPRHPTMLAGQALTTQAAIGGRLTLGIGLSHKPQVEGQWGMSFDRPVRHMLDYLNVLQPLVETGQVSYRGEAFTRVGEPMARPTDVAPPVMIAALGPQMLKIAGSRTAGTILWMVGEKTIESHIAPVMNEAAAEAGRPTPRVLCSLPVCITDNAGPVKEFAAAALKIYGELPSYRAMLDREGAAGPADVGLFGTEAEVAERLANIKAAGATDFAAVEFVGTPADAERTRAFLKDQIAAVA